MARISNRDEFKNWLKVQPRDVAVAVAVRSALRVVPIWAPIIEIDNGPQHLLSLFRALRLSSFDSPRKVSLQTNANANAYAAANAAANAAAYAAAANADNAAYAAWGAIEADAHDLEEGEKVSILLGRPLWPGGHPAGRIPHGPRFVRCFWRPIAPVSIGQSGSIGTKIALRACLTIAILNRISLR